MFNRILLRAIWFVCLALSIALSVLFFTALSKIFYYRLFIPVAVITVEGLAQVILSYGRAEWKAGLYFRAGVKMLLYAVYIIFFGILSGLSFFVSHIAANEREVDKIVHQETVLDEQYRQNNRLIESLNKQLLTEAGTGFGRRSETIMDEIKRLKNEQAELADKMDKIRNSALPEESLDVFRDMAEVIGVSANILKLLSFGVFVVFIFAGLIILNPDVTGVTFGAMQNVTDGVTGVTYGVTGKNMNVTGLCPVCNGPLKPGQTYCCNKCRQKAFRERKATHAAI